MPKNDVAKAPSDAPLKTVVDALDVAVKAAKDDAADGIQLRESYFPRLVNFFHVSFTLLPTRFRMGLRFR
jgi:hypothetical protein